MCLTAEKLNNTSSALTYFLNKWMCVRFEAINWAI